MYPGWAGLDGGSTLCPCDTTHAAWVMDLLLLHNLYLERVSSSGLWLDRKAREGERDNIIYNHTLFKKKIPFKDFHITMLENCNDVNLKRINLLQLKMRSPLSFPQGLVLSAL